MSFAKLGAVLTRLSLLVPFSGGCPQAHGHPLQELSIRKQTTTMIILKYKRL